MSQSAPACFLPVFLKANVTRVLHLNLDDAWEKGVLGLRTIELREWGPKLRFSSPSRVIEDFFASLAGQLTPFLVYGSGDFHHLSALWLRQLNGLTTLVSFDNHPDWDIRPPRWGCGSWINRALELPQIEKVSVWGCGNFECWWPMRVFGNRLAERNGRLEVHPWADGRAPRDQRRRGAILRQNWREKFAGFVEQLGARQIYVTIDLDCLREEEAMTNWENGRFHLEDVAWALELLAREKGIVAGDICGAWSPATYARRKQRFVSEMDHPKLAPHDPLVVRQRNRVALQRLLPCLTQRDQNDAEADNN